MRKRNYSKLMGIAAATLSAAVIASPMTAHAEGTNENTGVASESGSGASSSESTSSESGSSASSSEGTSSESGSGASSSEGTSSESNASGAASSSTEGTTASATESGASTSASSTEGATTTESTSTTSTGSTGTTSTETTDTTATGTSSTESTGTTTSESTGTSTATTVAPNGTTTSAPIAAEGNTSANMESTGTTVKAESTSSTTTNSDGSVTETVTTTTTTTEVKDPVFTTTDVQPGTADYDHIQTDADGNPVKDPNGDVIHPITKTEATQGTTTTVSTTTTSTTTKTETTTTTTMTNAEIWDNKNVHTLDKDGNLVKADTVLDKDGHLVKTNTTLEKDTKDYLNSQNVTADFDVYANTMDHSCGHIDGNIAVNRLNASTTLMNKENQYGTNRVTTSETNISGTTVDKLYAQNGYSYVGSVADGVYISTSSNQKTGNVNDSLLVTGSDVTNTDADGTANHFKSVTLTPGATVDGKVTEAAHQEALKQEARLKNLREVSDIKNNLADIANKGQKIIDDITAQTGTSNLTNLQKLQKIGELLEAGTLTNQDIITVTIGAAVLGDNNNAAEGDNNHIEAALAKLISANKTGANIVLNVVIGDQDVSVSTTGTQVFSVKRHLQNGYDAYDARAAYLNWNFGNFAGRINIDSTFSGNVIAPNAYLHAGNGLQSGRVVSDTASSGGELHHAIKGQIHEVTVKNVTVVSEESELKSESKNTTTNSWVSYTYPTYPETPETPETPSHHESHDDDDHDDPSWDIQYFTEDPHVLGVSREREIPISYMPFIEEGHVLGESRPKNPVENVLGVSRSVQTGDAGNMNAYAIASILSILTLAGWAVSYKER